jgi:bleomycin hydrolase
MARRKSNIFGDTFMSDTYKPQPIDNKTVTSFIQKFAKNPTNKLAQNAVTKNSINDIALNRDIITTSPSTFSIKLDDWKITNQKKSGRCWLFAGLNLFRVGAMKKMNLPDFEFSQNYAMFWDKFEKANFYLESIIATADKDIDDRYVAFLLDHPLDDGGQWNMFINIIRKYGVVPKSAMPETESSSATYFMNENIITKEHEGAKILRDLAAKGATEKELQTAKNEILEVIFRMLCIHLGTPPTSIDWQWEDKDKKFNRDGVMTPQQFAEKYITIPYEDYICLVNDPRISSPFYRTYTVEFLGNVVGGKIVKYLNIPSKEMKAIAVKTLESGEPVWFGCDVGKMMERKLGIWDANLLDFNGIYSTEFKMDKEARLFYHGTLMTHAMLFTGVDIVDDKPRRWRVENSWGDEIGEKGFFVMNDNWFDEHMFEIAARKEFLSSKMLKAFETEPIVLPPWDPMGSLA